jgi:hypothetical protein
MKMNVPIIEIQIQNLVFDGVNASLIDSIPIKIEDIVFT